MKWLYVSPSQLAAWQSCPRSWLFGRNYRPNNTPGNLAFGVALHEAIYQFLLGLIWNIQTDPVEVFRRVLKRKASHQSKWPNGWDLDVANVVGQHLVVQFMEWWKQERFEVLFQNGKPMLEVGHKVYLKNNIVLLGKADAIVWSPEHGIVVLDFKTARSPAPEWFASVAQQLTVYQILFDDYLRRRVNALGFVEMKKVKTESKMSPPACNIARRHTDSQVTHCLEQIQWMAEDVRRGRFPAQIGMAFNSPCNMCDYRELCQEGKKVGLTKKRSRALPESAVLS